MVETEKCLPQVRGGVGDEERRPLRIANVDAFDRVRAAIDAKPSPIAHPPRKYFAVSPEHAATEVVCLTLLERDGHADRDGL